MQLQWRMRQVAALMYNQVLLAPEVMSAAQVFALLFLLNYVSLDLYIFNFIVLYAV